MSTPCLLLYTNSGAVSVALYYTVKDYLWPNSTARLKVNQYQLLDFL